MVVVQIGLPSGAAFAGGAEAPEGPADGIEGEQGQGGERSSTASSEESAAQGNARKKLPPIVSKVEPGRLRKGPSGARFGIMPGVAWSNDDGLGLGIYGDYIRPDKEPTGRPFHFAATWNGKVWIKPQQVGWELFLGLSLFPLTSGASELSVGITTFGRPWDWWFGLGADSLRDRRSGLGEDHPVKDGWNRFRHNRVRGAVHLYQRIVGPLDAFFGSTLTWNEAGARSDTLLEAELAAAAVPGEGGGPTLTVEGGLRIDRRDDRVDPKRGGYLVGMLQSAFGPTAPWGRMMVDLRGYAATPGDEVVFAAQITAQTSVGAVPYYESGVFAGTSPYENAATGGFGLRALDRGRLRGANQILGRLEARIRPPPFDLLKLLVVRLAPVAWVDAVRVAGPDGDDEGTWPVTPGFGGGLRLHVNEVTVSRLDLGTAPERFRDDDGEHVRWTFAVYGTVGHAF